jgi:eukaryotic translation initiation factor 2C
VWLPPEICTILPDQPFRGKLSDDHTAAMIKIACQPPNINAQAIRGTGIPALGLQESDPSPTLQQFGLRVGNEMAIVPGRILQAPGVVYAGANRAQIKDGGWNLRNVKFTSPAALSNWAVLALRDGGRDDFTSENDPSLQQCIKGLANMCQQSGMTVDSRGPRVAVVDLVPKNREAQPPKRAQSLQNITDAIKKHFGALPRPKLILVMLSSGDKFIYAGIKRLADTMLDTLCVCVQSSKIRKDKGQLQYFGNVALKINAKLGGINHSLDDGSFTWLKQKPTMLMGSDVTHPGPGSLKGTPSVAAVVGNVDTGFGQYPASLRLQQSTKEVGRTALFI